MDIKIKVYSVATLLLSLCSLQVEAQSSLFVGAGPSVNHISMDIAPASIPYFDVVHRLSINAEVLYGYRFPGRWQVLAGAGMFSIKHGVEGGDGIQSYKPSFPKKYFSNKGYMHFSTITPFFLTAGGAFTFIQKPYFEADVSLMLDAVYYKGLNMGSIEGTSYGTDFLFDQYDYRTGWRPYLQPGLRLKRITHNYVNYWVKAKASIRTHSVLEVETSVLQYDNNDYEATIRTNGSTFAILAGVELPLTGRHREQKIAGPALFKSSRQLITARAGLSSQYPFFIEDSGHMLQAAPHIGGYLGVMLEERLSDPFYVGFGLTNFTVSTFYNFSLPTDILSFGASNHSLFGLPVSMAWYQTNKKWSVRLAGSLGYIFKFTKDSSGGGFKYEEGTAVLDNGDEFTFRADSFIPQTSTLYLDLDVSGNYSLSDRVALHSFIGYSYGFKRFYESSIIYQYNNEAEQAAKITFGLNHLNFGLGLRYALLKN